jgi:hypothetical protein
LSDSLLKVESGWLVGWLEELEGDDASQILQTGRKEETPNIGDTQVQSWAAVAS